MTADDLKIVIEKHRQWLFDEEGGERADLVRADLSGASLTRANLTRANLAWANLTGANLYRANLAGADLAGADLAGADLYRANLAGADLAGADLAGTNLDAANLYRANLAGADLDAIRDDIYSILEHAAKEALGLYDALMRGQVDGSCYEGECCCLVGTIARVRGVDCDALDGIARNEGRPAERWFLAIRPGDIPQNNQVSAITAGWLREWMDGRGIAYPRYEIVAVEESRP
jgi:hypothetical protein